MDFLKVDAGVEQQEERDVIGGFQVHDAGVYPVIIKAAYFDKSAGGANCITLLFTGSDGFQYSHTEYITNRKGDNFYIDKKDKTTKHLLPGMNRMLSLSKMIDGKDLNSAATEDKFHEIYSQTLKQKTPQERVTLVDWKDIQLQLGLLKIRDNKQVKNSDGKYIDSPTGEDTTFNELDKFFTNDGLTINEKIAGKPSAFMAEWSKANAGKTRDKYSPVAGGAQSGAPMGQAATAPLKFDE